MAAIDAQTLLKAYSIGVFPMARSRDEPELYWFDPDPRGILPLEDFHAPRRLLRTMRTQPLRITANAAFAEVMRACAAPRPGHPETWINDAIFDLYTELHQRGHAHSVEVWAPDEALVGGLYGVSLGSAFFGESMFSVARDASKVALCALVAFLRADGFRLLDTQYLTAHLAQFGAVEIPRRAYKLLLAEAMAHRAAFHSRAASSFSISSSMLG
ncbi:MAG: leucyl/phenylalanyl-tRNA--protein transferase [Alphaproteobacteria bacterium]|nr:leucyl/phenylalanyl-tRNA--protein transferase [Alphaproteobacteria bacterium]